MTNLRINQTPARQAPYFAYGSNMDLGRMAYRCPTAELVGIGRVDGWDIRIDGRGVATIDPSPATVWGLLWAVTAADEAALDRYEGVAVDIYRRSQLHVVGPAGAITALVYIGRNQETGQPRPGYLELILEAATVLPLDYQRRLANLGGALTQVAR